MKLCKACYGKGYYSYLNITIAYPDFYGDKTYIDPPKIIYRRCSKCKSRKRLPKDLTLTPPPKA